MRRIYLILLLFLLIVAADYPEIRRHQQSFQVLCAHSTYAYESDFNHMLSA